MITWTEKKVKITDVIPSEYNPRTISDHDFKALKRSLKKFGQAHAIICNKNMAIIGGHQTVRAAKELEWEFVNISIPDKQISKNKENALNLALNRIHGEWDDDKLEGILAELDTEDIELTGFDEDELQDILNGIQDNASDGVILTDRFIVPPFSILDTKQGYWVDRKRIWNDMIHDTGETRKECLGNSQKAGGSFQDLKFSPNESILDPVLAEILLKWFNVSNGSACDPFAGDTVFGYVCGYLGYNFTGVELRQEQVSINTERCSKYKNHVKYICDDGQSICKHIDKNSMDFLFSCPPYFDLEIYSDLDNDASNQKNYNDFIRILKTAFSESIECLKNDRFAAIVISDVRDKDGSYRNIPKDIIKIFCDNGMVLYNDMILADRIGTAPARANAYMKNRKVVSVHQNILIFFKGNIKTIKNNYMQISTEWKDDCQ